ncbi:zinc finger MYM-type protein 4-like isoform X2 [Gouania willdenowi]|nr:zinc finger MYM-type protein 4-like isoform X2 [Gouania willdenowi]
MSRVFDEVMGLGEFADSSRGSAGSCKSSSQDEAKGVDETSGHEEQPPVEDDSCSGRQEEKMNTGVGESRPPPISSSSPQHSSSFNISTSEGGGGGSGAAAFDDALDGLPSLGREEETEEWNFSLPIGALEDVDVTKESSKRKEAEKEDCETQAHDTREEEEDEREISGSTLTSDSFDHTPENSQDGGGVPSQAEETEDSQQEAAEAAPVEDNNHPVSPSVNIKDEPEDEGYDAALLPQSSARQIKEELEQEEELRISSVFSVGGGNTFTPPTMPAPISAAPAPVPTALFIPGRGAVLQAMTPLTVRPPAPTTISLPSIPHVPLRPPPPALSGCVRCSGCTKVLLKGQTAFQRKGSTQLFCSTVCLTGHLPPIVRNRVCFQCKREIVQPRDMVTIPASDRSFMHFCGQFCLSVFQHKKKVTDKVPEKMFEKKMEKKPEKPPEKPTDRQPVKPLCSVCRMSSKIEHEVNHQGRLHNLCSDACFATWRMMRQLAMNCCEVCGLYCNSSSGSCQTLTIEKSQLNFCSPTCISTYKQTSTKTVECANCRKSAVVSTTTMERDQKGKVQLYCSATCVGRSRPQRHILTDTAFPCSLCKVSAVPQFHLAMADGTIRNFCSFSCVTIYRKTSHASQSELTNGTPSLKDPVLTDAPKMGLSSEDSSIPSSHIDSQSSLTYQGSHPSQTSVPPLVSPYTATFSQSLQGQTQTRPPSQSQKPAVGGSSDGPKVTCHQCFKQFNTKPLLFSHCGRIFVFCQMQCSEQYKIQRNILAVCEYCKQEKVHYDTICFNQKDLFFCGEKCKSQFKQDQVSHKKDQSWNPCSYCGGISQNVVPVYSHFGGRMEEFCRSHCMSQYTVLYYGMGRCDSCRKQGQLMEKLQCLGSVRNFCDMPCLLQYCYFHFETIPRNNSTGTAPQTPRAPTKSQHSSKMNPVIAEVVSLANGLANQPFGSADTALTGALPTSNTDGKNLDHASTQTDALRVPVPRRRQMKNKSVLCRPITMDQENMCQLPSTESGAGEPGVKREPGVKLQMVPIPVPVFIPVPMNMYSQYTPVTMTIPMPVPVPLVVPPQKKDMKDAAVQSEPVMEDKQGEVSYAVQNSSHNGDPTSELAAPSRCEEAHIPRAEPPFAEKDAESADLPSQSLAHAQTSPTTSQLPPSRAADELPSSPVMDLESDFPTESLDHKSSATKRGVKRPREGSTGRKRGRRRTRSLDRSAVLTSPESELNHMYGVKAWRSWVQQSSDLEVKEDILMCNSAELSFALSRFIKEVCRPNGESYSADSIFYLCLGIQQYLFLKGRIENIFTDDLYSQFASDITGMLRQWKPKLLPNGCVALSRVEESFLWECKQLGAYSPIVLLNTLLFFCTKNFSLSTVAQHQSLSFSNLIWCSRVRSRGGKVHYLQYQRGSDTTPRPDDTEHLRTKQAKNNVNLEMVENISNPLHCPVRLYEFYLSRCPESAKQRGDLFYLQPEQNVHTHSLHWYTSQPLDTSTLQSMLTRILAVREVQQGQEAAVHQPTGSEEL